MGKVYVLFAIFFLAALDSCRVPASHETEQIENYRTALIAQKVQQLDILQYPLWWVQEDYAQTGGSPYVVVFHSDGLIYTRTRQNKKLASVGWWDYDLRTQQLKVSENSNVKLGILVDGRWDNYVTLNDVKLVSGQADYNQFILQNWWITNNVKYLKGNTYEKGDFLAFYLNQDGTINIGVGPSAVRANWAAEDPYGKVPAHWKVSTLGDYVISPEGIFELSFDGKVRMIKFDYKHRIHKAEQDTSIKDSYIDGVQADGPLISRY